MWCSLPLSDPPLNHGVERKELGSNAQKKTDNRVGLMLTLGDEGVGRGPIDLDKQT